MASVKVNITLNTRPEDSWQYAKLWREQGERAAIMAAFWARVKRGTAEECWLWVGSENGRGYGQFGLPRVAGRRVRIRAHRFAWLVSRGPVPTGWEVCHRCDNTRCVNPGHLYVAPHRENHLDAVRKGRKRAWGLQKLNAEQVGAIRARAASGAPQRELAAQFGVAPNTISQIVRGVTWAHLNSPLPAFLHSSAATVHPLDCLAAPEPQTFVSRARAASGASAAAVALPARRATADRVRRSSYRQSEARTGREEVSKS